MKLTRHEMISFLLETESMRMHGYSTMAIRNMPTKALVGLMNEIFEPIDEDIPFQEKINNRLTI